ncbi:hypothetical protein AAZX31_09G111700 [Glycine max]
MQMERIVGAGSFRGTEPPPLRHGEDIDGFVLGASHGRGGAEEDEGDRRVALRTPPMLSLELPLRVSSSTADCYFLSSN